MSRTEKETDVVFQRVKGMYNAHPFPNRNAIPDVKSDERYKQIYEKFLHVPLTELRDMKFLDAGCGTGDVTWVWRRLLHPSNTVYAIDLSNASVNIARQAMANAEISPIFSVGSLLDIPLPDHSVDFVHCSGVLVAVTEPERAFRELCRILKPGGYMMLVLYHKYGRSMHGARRAVIDFLEPEDIDRRAQLGGKLFGRSMRKFEVDELSPLEGILYDQFGLPCETRYSVGDGLRWFEQGNIDYLGTWPPVEWSQLGKGIRFSNQFGQKPQSRFYKLLTRIFADTDEAPNQPPSLSTRATMESLWFLNQQQLFSISGQKRS